MLAGSTWSLTPGSAPAHTASLWHPGALLAQHAADITATAAATILRAAAGAAGRERGERSAERPADPAAAQPPPLTTDDRAELLWLAARKPLRRPLFFLVKKSVSVQRQL
eukprot:SAG25_NODE_4112_length_886_cov_4.747141_1_plen_109_part_10